RACVRALGGRGAGFGGVSEIAVSSFRASHGPPRIRWADDGRRAPVTIPRISTDRLLLREPRTSDFDTFARFYADAEMTRFLSGTLDRRSAWRVFASIAGAWLLTGAGGWAVEVRETGEYVGTVGAFFRADLGNVGPDSDLELGWVLFP